MRLGPATCNRPCTGDADQTCGGRNAISLYKYSYSAAGCYKDNRDRVLTEKYFDSDDMTTQVCKMIYRRCVLVCSIDIYSRCSAILLHRKSWD